MLMRGLGAERGPGSEHAAAVLADVEVVAAGQPDDGEEVAAVDPGRDVEIDAIALGRVEVAVGVIVEDRQRQADQLVVHGDAVARDARQLAGDAEPCLPARREGAVEAGIGRHGVARIGVEHLAQASRLQPRILAAEPIVGLAEGGAEGKARVEDRIALPDMGELGRQPQALGLAEQVAMGPEARDREAELRLVGDAKADRARRPVGQFDIERQLTVGIERGCRLDAHRVEHAERGELAAQGLDLGWDRRARPP